MSRRTGYVWHELYAWHNTGIAAGMLPASRTIQPDLHIESPETKRRFAELVVVSGLIERLTRIKPQPASNVDIGRVHNVEYMDRIRRLSDTGGGDAGELTPFGADGYEIAALSAGGCIELARAIWMGEIDNGYALCRPPGHHAEPELGRGFCLFANGAIAVRHLQAVYGVERVALVDWDVHHGNGTQKIFYRDPNVLTISLHQDNCYPPQSGALHENGEDAGLGANINVPLPPGCGHRAYEAALRRVVVPALERFKPQIVIVLSGLDANAMDPLGRMLLHSDSYRTLTGILLDAAQKLCGGKLAMFHEGGYSAAYVPYCGLAIIEELVGHRTDIRDPFLDLFADADGNALLPHQASIIEAARELIPRIPAP